MISEHQKQKNQELKTTNYLLKIENTKLATQKLRMKNPKAVTKN